MSSKGRPNLYGGTKYAKKIGFAYAKKFNRFTQNRHFLEHGKGLKRIEQYTGKAVRFANKLGPEMAVFIDKRGSTHKYSRKTGEYAIIDKRGYVVTYFNIGSLTAFNKNKDKEGVK